MSQQMKTLLNITVYRASLLWGFRCVSSRQMFACSEQTLFTPLTSNTQLNLRGYFLCLQSMLSLTVSQCCVETKLFEFEFTEVCQIKQPKCLSY